MKEWQRGAARYQRQLDRWPERKAQLDGIFEPVESAFNTAVIARSLDLDDPIPYPENLETRRYRDGVGAVEFGWNDGLQRSVEVRIYRGHLKITGGAQQFDEEHGVNRVALRTITDTLQLRASPARLVRFLDEAYTTVSQLTAEDLQTVTPLSPYPGHKA